MGHHIDLTWELLPSPLQTQEEGLIHAVQVHHPEQVVLIQLAKDIDDRQVVVDHGCRHLVAMLDRARRRARCWRVLNRGRSAGSAIPEAGENPHMKHANEEQLGYMLLDITPERVQGEWYYSTPQAP